MVVVTLTQTAINKHKKMQTRPGNACGHKITDCYLTETKLDFSIAFQTLQNLELNVRHTIETEKRPQTFH